jgi:uncharacterized protein YndB with AHSA1/START domain
MHLRTEVTIDRPREEVFRRLADEMATTTPLICPLTASVTLDRDQTIGAGVTGRIIIQNLFASATVVFEVTRYEKGERLSFEARYRTRSSQTDYLFRDEGSGTTVVMVTDAPAIGPAWLQGWNERVLRRHEHLDAHRLKALLEGRGRVPILAVMRRNRGRSYALFVATGAILALSWFLLRTWLAGA